MNGCRCVRVGCIRRPVSSETALSGERNINIRSVVGNDGVMSQNYRLPTPDGGSAG